uniref:Rho GTPase activator Rga n=1 Tax=Ganoderma boninense TaxID=34458 RepID=A0A5K1JX03_9APHY|nr:Rho GTPase activator Rga [Ganoderma boninense]
MDGSIIEETNLKPNQTHLIESWTCRKCETTIAGAKEGVVVAFGKSFFHVDCFQCAKCATQLQMPVTVGADSPGTAAGPRVLQLADGAPICAGCSYRCGTCTLPILDEAILTGDEAYHTHCFRCRACERQIEELVFAKTSRGNIYCMGCHNERLERGRQRKAKKQPEGEELEHAAAGLQREEPWQETEGLLVLEVRSRL